MAPKLKAFVGRTAAAIEYGVIAAGLSLAIIVVVNGLTEHNAAYSSISTHLNKKQKSRSDRDRARGGASQPGRKVAVL